MQMDVQALRQSRPRASLFLGKSVCVEMEVSIFNYIKGNGEVYKDLNLARASGCAINRHVTC